MSADFERQVVERHVKHEVCERCGAVNAFRTDHTCQSNVDGSRVAYAHCTRCGAPVLIYYRRD